ncbi:type I methionyl aminopeptidase [Patescibacteria group bacterium]|nr:type I methionyl aminopeptidase [Patescibacteria group bacterium]
MSLVKTPQEIEQLKQGGVILSAILRELREKCVAGVETEALDALAKQRMEERGGRPSFLGYRPASDMTPFPGTLCISINEEVVHGLPLPSRTIKAGDIVGLDIGMWRDGLATDMATTVIVGEVSEPVRVLVRETRAALELALTHVKAGKWIHDIGNAIDDYLTPQGYGIVRDLVGHGVGHAVHEEPAIPHFRDRFAPRVKMREGMVLAIEPMVTLGTWKVKMKPDGWTVVTADKKPAAHFELTIVVTNTGYELVTPWPDV